MHVPEFSKWGRAMGAIEKFIDTILSQLQETTPIVANFGNGRLLPAIIRVRMSILKRLNWNLLKAWHPTISIREYEVVDGKRKRDKQPILVICMKLKKLANLHFTTSSAWALKWRWSHFQMEFIVAPMWGRDKFIRNHRSLSPWTLLTIAGMCNVLWRFCMVKGTLEMDPEWNIIEPIKRITRVL